MADGVGVIDGFSLLLSAPLSTLRLLALDVDGALGLKYV